MNHGTRALAAPITSPANRFAALGINMVHAVQGHGQATPALVGGQVQMIFSALPAIAGFVKDNRVKLLAQNSEQALSQAPNIPPSPRQPSPALTSRPPPS